MCAWAVGYPFDNRCSQYVHGFKRCHLITLHSLGYYTLLLIYDDDIPNLEQSYAGMLLRQEALGHLLMFSLPLRLIDKMTYYFIYPAKKIKLEDHMEV